MLKATAIAFFGGTPPIARALEVSDAAVYQWGDVVPLESAMALEKLTGGKLPIDRAQYEKLKRADRMVRLGAKRTQHAVGG